MRNVDLLQLQEDLKKVKDLRGKCNYAIAKNWSKLDTEIRKLRNMVPAIPELANYQMDLNKINSAYRTKIVNGKLSEEEQKNKDKEVEELNIKYKETLDKESEAQKLWAEILYKDVDMETLKFHMIQESDVDMNATLEQKKILLPFIKE